MIYRKFEANPPSQPDPHPELAARLWDIVQIYINPRLILRDKYATVASLAIGAIVAMRSKLASKAVQAASASGFTWFSEMVTDDLQRLSAQWETKNAAAVEWCNQISQGGDLSAGNASR